MLQHAVALLLQRLLGKFVTFDSSMLRLSLWQGDLSFQDLQLRLSYGEGAIGHLSVKIPWRALWTQPVQIKAQGIRVSLHRTPSQQAAREQEQEHELEGVDTSIEGGNGDDRTYLSRLVSHIIANVQIELSDVQVRYDCDPSSLAPQPGSGTLEIGHVSLINTNADWELEFTPQSSSAMESRKLLKTEGVAAYIEYPEEHSAAGSEEELASPKMRRKYLFHEWRSTVKASLFYHSVNAAFPDVELDVDIGCEPGSVTEQCEICAAHNTSSNDTFVLPANQPRIHIGPEHIDVLYAILIEVKAPYDEYDRLAVLTQQQASRPEGFLTILSYAKQWLLTDCLDAVVGETFTLAADSDDDDDDEFEDAITPPSLSKCEGMEDMSKCHLEFDQHGVYFSQLPDLQIDASFPLSNSFLLVFDHFVEGSTSLSRRNSFVLAPVETRFSVQDANLFINIANNYLRWIPSSTRSTPAKTSASGTGTNGNSSSAVTPATAYVADKLLGDVGELRLVLVNNSLGIPIADFHMREIVCEYIKDEDYSTTMGATLLFNYFNNSIYRWEPLVEPFVVQMRIHRALEENSLVEVFANLPNTVNFNMTPAMAPLLSSEALRQADFVTSGSKSTAPFWVENKTGVDLKFSFRRGTGTVIQQVVADNGKVSVDCREQGDMLSFDSASADRFLRETDRQALTIELVGGSVALIFREESKRFPPYRIDNMTSFRIRFKQTNWGEDKDFDELLPRSSCPYSWDYLNGSEGKSSSSSNQDPAFPGSSSSSSRSLQVRFMRVTSSTSKSGEDSDKDAVEIREYNLDEMATHKRIQLHRSLPSELFLKPEQKGYLLKKDSMLKWNRKYFRLYEHMLYYFANEADQELLGVVDLRTGSDVPGVGGVAIFEKTAEAPSKSGFISLNGLVSSISGSLFGSGSRQKDGDGDGDDDDEDGDDRSRELVRLAVSLTTSSLLCEESEKFVTAHIENETAVPSDISRKGFYVNGQDLVDFLVTEMSTQTKAQAFTTAQEMMELGVLKPVQLSTEGGGRKQAPLRSFQCSKIVWYSVDSINLADDSDVDSEDSSSITTPRDSISASTPGKAKPVVVGSNQFSIITPTKCYDLKAKNPKIARIWVRRLRLATQAIQAEGVEELPEETPMAGALLAPKTARSQRDLLPQVQNAKTYVHVRIRADGPTKVLELFEGGEEDFDEKENKYELSSTASASSDSPTASETSTNAFDSLTSGMALHLRVDGIGISCVNELPMELVYIYMGGISLHYSRLNSNMRMNITLDDLQIDNQSEEATFTKLLCPRMEAGVVAAATPTRKRTIGDIDEDLAEMVSQGRGTAGGSGDDELQETTGLIANQNIFSCADCKYRQANVATMHFCCTWSNEQGNTDYFKHCSFWLYPVITQLDEELLVSARVFMAAMSQSWGENRSQNRGGEIRMKSIPIETMTESLGEYRENTLSDELNPLKSLESYTETSSSETRKVYFALLHIHPMDFDITFRSDVFQTSTTISLHEAASFKKTKMAGGHADELKRSSSAPSSFGESSSDESSSAMTWAIPSLTMHVPDLDNAPVRLNALMIEHAFGTSGDLTRRVSKYYTRQLWKQLHKILGSFDFLGNPVGFLDHIGTGVRDFVYEPLEGLKIGGKGFSKGLAKGTASLMSNTVDGTFDAASKISGTFGQGFANLSLDDHYQQHRARARRRHVRGLREGLVQGSRELSLGVYEGVAGLVLNPMRGAQESGAVGFVRGTITGIIGLPVKPVAGIFDFASRATQGVRNRSLQNGQNMRRVRRPRVFGRYNELKCYKEADTIAYELLKRVGGDRLSGEKIIFYNEIMQSVSAADLTREARDRRRSGSIGNGKPKSSNDSTRERTNSLRRALQESDERRRAAGEPPNASSGESSGRKLRYEVVFYQKKLGMDLETDFYCENVTIKAMDETSRSKVKVRGQLVPGQQVLQEGDCLIGVGGVDVRGIGFHETLALLRGTTRPITIQFESAEELLQESATPKPDSTDGGGIDIGATSRARLRRLSLAGPDDSTDESIKKVKVQLSHWLIVTEQRVLYINVGSFAKPVVEWMTPLRYIYRVEWQKAAARLCLHLSVGVDSLPMGPRMRPSLKAIDGHERDMNVFLDVMWHSFGSATAEEQELWPSDTSLNGYLLKKGGFSTVRRWFVLSRNCLYYFSSRKQLRGIIPLGHVRLETDAGDSRCLRITNATRSQPLVTLQLDSGQVVERVQSEVVLVAASTQELEMWQSSLAHAAGKGMRHSRGTRFFVPTAASRLEIGTQETPDFVVKPLADALKKTVEVFNTKLP
ncbi:vacuolar protein sorting-associated [Phytophthora cinnamomi]|uniref:vacuolar protein sorting-associated n=1 Tax=Phytophthora cinnamomi TaxID=4785 RepID=UPI003559417C|nr:vacuolar protein sorting-associated [Phytophthora cinnamomi]